MKKLIKIINATLCLLLSLPASAEWAFSLRDRDHKLKYTVCTSQEAMIEHMNAIRSPVDFQVLARLEKTGRCGSVDSFLEFEVLETTAYVALAAPIVNGSVITDKKFWVSLDSIVDRKPQQKKSDDFLGLESSSNLSASEQEERGD